MAELRLELSGQALRFCNSSVKSDSFSVEDLGCWWVSALRLGFRDCRRFGPRCGELSATIPHMEQWSQKLS